MKLGWLTDIHYDQLSTGAKQALLKELLCHSIEGLIISGDIADPPVNTEALIEFARELKKPIYFVFGNHDYYHQGIELGRQRLSEILDKNLCWLPSIDYIELSSEVALIGQDGWADTRYGDYQNSSYHCYDGDNIPEFIVLRHDKAGTQQFMQQLADTDAQRCYEQVTMALDAGYRRLLIVTHVPPFVEASRFKGKQNDPDTLPYFANKALGDILLKLAREQTECQFEVYCGHTHFPKTLRVLDNLLICVGRPRTLQEIT